MKIIGAKKEVKNDSKNDNDLRKLNRADLLELLLEQTKRADALERELEQKNRELEEKRIMLENAGSIAEAAMKLNGVFEAAQRAADQYLYSIKEGFTSKNENSDNKEVNNEADTEPKAE